MPLGYWDSGYNCYWDPTAAQCTGLDTFGNGDYNGLTYYNGDPASGYYSSIPGSAYSNTYFISGQATSLDNNGSGSWNGSYYLSGVQTTLDSCGNGSYNNQYYVEGSQSESAYSNCAIAWVWQGVPQSGLSQSGDGYSWTSSQYFLAGVVTTLDSSGNGFWQSHAYYNGAQQATGWNGYYWYINDQQTTLDSSGNGTWNGGTYVNGVLQVPGTIFEGTSGFDWNDVSNWNGGTPQNPVSAQLLPDGSSPIWIRGSLETNNSNAAIDVPSITVLAGGSLRISVTAGGGTGTVTVYGEIRNNPTISGNVVVRGAGTITGGAVVSGTVEFRDTSVAVYDGMFANTINTSAGVTFRDASECQVPVACNTLFLNNATMTGSASIDGTATFRNNSGNAKGCTAISRQHGGGINGSNILGLV